MAKTKTEAEKKEAEQQQAVEAAAAELENLGWHGPFSSAPDPQSGEPTWRASRAGTSPSEIASSTLEGLVSAVQEREPEIAAGIEASVAAVQPPEAPEE